MFFQELPVVIACCKAALLSYEKRNKTYQVLKNLGTSLTPNKTSQSLMSSETSIPRSLYCASVKILISELSTCMNHNAPLYVAIHR
jgi:hypothetical protein